MSGRLSLFALSALAACAPRPAGPAPAPPPVEAPVVADGPFASRADYQTQRQAALAALDTAIGEPTAGAVVACQVIALGERPCGGPASFVVMSTETASVPDVLGVAGRVAALDRQATAQFELASTCELRTAPPAALRDGRCVLGE